jgi:predicted amidohydrolase
VVCYQGFRFLLITCYDLRFPVWTRYQGDYDAIICVANWPESRQDVWHILLRARAIENQCYVIGCNRVGDDPNCHYIGYSAVIDSRGRTIVEDHEERELTLTAEIDKDSLQAFRQKFRVLDDRDIFHLTPR